MNKGERTKNYIIEQSSSLFNKNGYKSTSISEIMAATGLKKGGIYNHFENKDDLAKASFSYALNTLKNNYIEAVTSKSTAIEQFNAFISVFKTLIQDEFIMGGCPLMNAAIEADDSKVEFEDLIKEGFFGLIKLIKGIIQHGKNQNEINKAVDSDQMAVFILSSLEGALALSRLYKDDEYLEMVILQIKSNLF
ncbi:TetR/AcrR family transcriptional regulator [Bacillus sp. ISL-40]|uniref:TetR/AcrR family transcriptional regulator n=1 Tax=unclassified Bacillus (in: firmicutes) TaxID=185979 RepID=UPI001BE86813|nr:MULTISPECIES: TetR/AcrR family transcriptional regulator [unclassified Bacillus (in: firmicutes)]MBT2697512.1 TetR/AcrR family transcriptional regulator [Bacillus sp. ISL-40]MBT2720938.1 TetR/AcrR family transcriptional regulator [Bacillus sp. ISL-46]MBT2742217.1 TetR/AcrR family transcriptional regulator [Bacillus sp. ISL-77]